MTNRTSRNALPSADPRSQRNGSSKLCHARTSNDLLDLRTVRAEGYAKRHNIAVDHPESLVSSEFRDLVKYRAESVLRLVDGPTT
jgi:hypothetical protein